MCNRGGPRQKPQAFICEKEKKKSISIWSIWPNENERFFFFHHYFARSRRRALNIKQARAPLRTMFSALLYSPCAASVNELMKPRFERVMNF